MKIRILILSVGSLCAHNLLCMLQSHRGDHVILGTNSLAEAAGAFLCDAAYLVPPARDADAYASALVDLIEAEAPDIVVPTRDDDVLALARMKTSYKGSAVFIVGSAAAAETMDDKRLTAAFARRRGLPFAPTTDTHAGALKLAERHGYPLIAKPARGNGTRDVTLLLDRSQLDAALDGEDVVVQKFLDGPVDMARYKNFLRQGLPLFFSFPVPNQYAFQIVIGADGEFSEPYASLNTMVMGKPERSERLYDERLLALGMAYAEAIREEGWVGPFNAQFKRTPEGEFVGFELNGRFTGSSAARALSGFNEWDEVLRGFGFSSTARPSPPGEVGITHGILTHYPVPAEELASLQAKGSWRRSS